MGYRTVLTIAITAIMAMLILAAFVLVFINRDSEKIVSAAIPLALATFSALALIFAFAREGPMTRIFPVNFLFQVRDKQPIQIGARPYPHQLFFFSELRQRNPDALEDAADSRVIYHEFLQKMLVDWIAMRHFGHWRMEILQFEAGPGWGTQSRWGPMIDADREPVKILLPEDLERIFGENRFASLYSGFGKLALPLGTTVSVKTPQEPGSYGEIRFKNIYSEITIQTSSTGWAAGLGAYSMLLGIPVTAPEFTTQQRDYRTQEYIVRIKATFKPWLIGHPRMALIKQWVAGILNGLQEEFDEQIVWRKTVENIRLNQDLSSQPRSVPLPLGPVQAAPPAQGEKSDK